MEYDLQDKMCGDRFNTEVEMMSLDNIADHPGY